MRERDGLGILVLTQQGVERDEHLNAVGVGIANHLRQIVQRVTGCLPCSEGRRSDIDGIGTGLDSRAGYLSVSGRSEEAKRYITMPAVTDTFIECLVPYCGISMH